MFSLRRYSPPDPSDRYRPKIGICENWVRRPRGTRWAISRSKIDGLDIRNRIRLQCYAAMEVATWSPRHDWPSDPYDRFWN
jgi:hypothetical protein